MGRGPAERVTVGHGFLADHEEHAVTIKATEARQQFFHLLGRVVADTSALVIVEHKDLPGRAMLVSESYRDYVRQLEHLVRVMSAPSEPLAAAFRLAGSMSLAEDGDSADVALDTARARGRRLAARKFADL